MADFTPGENLDESQKKLQKEQSEKNQELRRQMRENRINDLYQTVRSMGPMAGKRGRALDRIGGILDSYDGKKTDDSTGFDDNKIAPDDARDLSGRIKGRLDSARVREQPLSKDLKKESDRDRQRQLNQARALNKNGQLYPEQYNGQVGPDTDQLQDNSGLSGKKQVDRKDKKNRISPSLKDAQGQPITGFRGKAGEQLERSLNEYDQHRYNSPAGRLAEDRALKRGLSQTKAKGAAAGAEALARGEGAGGATESALSGAMEAKKYAQFRMLFLAIRGVAGISIVGIIILVLIWGVQLVLGHILGNEKWKMTKLELPIAIFVWMLLLVIIGIVIAVQAIGLAIITSTFGEMFGALNGIFT